MKFLLSLFFIFFISFNSQAMGTVDCTNLSAAQRRLIDVDDCMTERQIARKKALKTANDEKAAAELARKETANTTTEQPNLTNPLDERLNGRTSSITDSANFKELGFVFLAIFIILGSVIYFLPSIVAKSRTHYSFLGVFVLNFLLGWTFIGWVAALVWAISGRKASPSETLEQPSPPPSHANEKKCPYCAELILYEAKKCKHCFSDLSNMQ